MNKSFIFWHLNENLLAIITSIHQLQEVFLDSLWGKIVKEKEIDGRRSWEPTCPVRISGDY